MGAYVVIDMNNVLPLLDEAVQRKGRDYRYFDDHDACVYFTKNSRGPVPQYGAACVIGHVLENVGVGQEALEAIRTCRFDVVQLFGQIVKCPEDTVRWYIFRAKRMAERLGDRPIVEYGIEVTPGALMVLKAAQVWQDQSAWVLDDESQCYIRQNAHTWGEAYDHAAEVWAALLEAGVQ